MAVIKSIVPKSNTLIAVWHIKESEQELLLRCKSLLTREECEKLKKISNVSRRCQWMAVRLLLKKMSGSVYRPIVYLQNGTPTIEGKEISIAHTSKFAAIILSDSSCGIDIELPRSSVLAISARFLSVTEIASLPRWMQELKLSETELLTLLWSSKEALFKMLKTDGLGFSTQLKCVSIKSGIADFLVKNKEKEQQFKCRFTKISGHYLVSVFD